LFDIDIPSNIRLENLFTVTFTIQNLTLHLAELVSFVEASDSFVFAGYKQMAIRILPLSTFKLKLHFLPIMGGRQAIPLLRVLKRSDALAMSDGGTMSVSKADADKCFAITAAEVHKFGSKNGELYVHVFPSLTEE
jgi:hypothetical protein